MACPMAFLIQMVAAKGCCCVGYSLKTFIAMFHTDNETLLLTSPTSDD